MTCNGTARCCTENFGSPALISIQHDHLNNTNEYQKNKTSRKKEAHVSVYSPKYKALSARGVQKVSLPVNSVDHMDIQQ